MNEEPTTEPVSVEPAPADHQPTPKSGFWGSISQRWRSLSRRQQVLVGAVSAVAVLIVAVLATPLRYPVLGLAYKGQLTVTVVDDKTHQPVPDATVAVGSHTALTDIDGQAHLSRLPLGHQNATITSHTYQTKTVTTTIFLGTKRLGQVEIHSTGVPVKFAVTNWVTGKPLADAKITIGSSSGASGDDGSATVSIDLAAVKGAKATVSSSGFNDMTIDIKPVAQTNSVALVPAGRIYFFSNRSGRIDLYGADLDGGNQTNLLKGSGSEDSTTGLLPSVESPNVMAILSSRAGHHDSNGTLQHDLYIFNGQTKALKQIDTKVSFYEFRAWVGDTLVYVKTESNGGYSIKGYSTSSNSVRTIAAHGKPAGDGWISATGLGVAGNKLYFSVDCSDASQAGFFRVGSSGSPQRISNYPVNQVYRQAKDSIVVDLYYNDSAHWRRFDFGSGNFTNLPGEPSSESNRGYADSANGQHSVFVETRDGKSQLYVTDGSGNGETAVTTSGTVNQFVQWFNDQYVAYTNSEKGSSIYIVSIAGGKEQKVTDFFQGNGKTYGGGYNPGYF